MNRRKVIASIGTVAIAGCVNEDTSDTNSEESDSDGITPVESSEPDQNNERFERDDDERLEEQIEDALEEEDPEPVQEPESETTILNQHSRRIPGGEYIYWEFELFRTVLLELRTTVRSGPNVDIIVTGPDEFNQFERGNRYRYNPEISQEDTIGGHTSFRFPGGDYIIFIYNNGYSTSTVDIELTATG